MNAAEKYPRYKRESECPCDHKCPVVVRIGDRTISRKPKRNGMVRVERFCDCAFCGPYSVEMEVLPSYYDNSKELIRLELIPPYRKFGERRNAGIRRSN